MSIPSFCVFGGALIDRVGLFDTAFHPGQSHPGHWQQTIGGVGSNVARHLAHFGAKVTFASVFADDPAAGIVRRSLLDDGLVLVPDCTIPESVTPTYTVMHDSSGDVIAGLADMALHRHMDEAWARKVALAGADQSHWIADTNMSPATLAELIRLKGEKPLFVVVVSPAKTTGLMQWLPGINGLICNRQEAEALSASSFPDAPGAAKALTAAGLPFCIVSDGSRTSALSRKAPDHTMELAMRAPVSHADEPTDPLRQHHRMTGAGDMFAAASLFAHCANSDTQPDTILTLGHAAARLAMQEDDTCPAIGWPEIVDMANHASSGPAAKESLKNE